MCRTDDYCVTIKLMMMTMKKKSDEMCRTAGLYIPSFLSNRYKSASSPCHDSNDDDHDDYVDDDHHEQVVHNRYKTYSQSAKYEKIIELMMCEINR